MSWHHHQLLCGGPETLPADNIDDRCATINKVLRSLAICRHLYMMTPSLGYMLLDLPHRASVSHHHHARSESVRPWSNFLVSLTTRAAAFITRYRVSVTDFVAPASTALYWSTREITNASTSVAADSESSDRRTRLS